MAGPGADDAMPRAKRLKLLREAKARKERGESGDGEASALVAAALKAVADELMTETSSEPKKEHEDAAMAEAGQSEENAAADLVEKVAQAQEEDTKTEDESEDELLNLAPKRANWDMERDIAPMLRKLEKRTQHAIVEILREKLAAEQQQEDDADEEDDEEEAEEVDE